MKMFRKSLAIVGAIALLGACLGAGISGIFTQVNSTNGYQVNGAAGITGQALCSNGTYFATPCTVSVGVDQYGSLSGCSFPNDGGGLNCAAGSIIWGTAFANTSYTATCSINYSTSIAGGSSTQPVLILNWTPTSTTAMSITEGVAQGSSGGWGVDHTYGATIYCHAHHS